MLLQAPRWPLHPAISASKFGQRLSLSNPYTLYPTPPTYLPPLPHTYTMPTLPTTLYPLHTSHLLSEPTPQYMFRFVRYTTTGSAPSYHCTTRTYLQRSRNATCNATYGQTYIRMYLHDHGRTIMGRPTSFHAAIVLLYTISLRLLHPSPYPSWTRVVARDVPKSAKLCPGHM